MRLVDVEVFVPSNIYIYSTMVVGQEEHAFCKKKSPATLPLWRLQFVELMELPQS